MRNRNRYRKYLTIEAFVILLVMGSFRLIPDRQIAAVVASLLFLASTLGILFNELKYKEFNKKVSFYTLLCFLCLSIIPIMALRLLNWGESFDQLSMAGFTGAQLHSFSNYIFIAVMVGFFIDSHMEQIRQFEDGQQIKKPR